MEKEGGGGGGELGEHRYLLMKLTANVLKYSNCSISPACTSYMDKAVCSEATAVS